MEIQGTIIKIGETEVIGQKGFKKRQVVIKTEAQYPQTIPVDFTQDKCSLLDKHSINDFVSISINVQGNEWQGKYYVGLQGWKIQNTEAEKSSSSFMPDRQGVEAMMQNAEQTSEEDNDLPF
jgi:hypothetical protein